MRTVTAMDLLRSSKHARFLVPRQASEVSTTLKSRIAKRRASAPASVSLEKCPKSSLPRFPDVQYSSLTFCSHATTPKSPSEHTVPRPHASPQPVPIPIPTPISIPIAISTTIHPDNPLISPHSLPSKAEQLRMILTEECPGCSRSKSIARSQAAEDLMLLIDEHGHAVFQLLDVEEELREQQETLLMLARDELAGAHGPQIIPEVQALMDGTERRRQECLLDLVAVEGIQRKRRREWGRQCESMFGDGEKEVSTSKPAPKGRISVRIRPDRRFFSCMAKMKGVNWYQETNLLEVP